MQENVEYQTTHEELMRLIEETRKPFYYKPEENMWTVFKIYNIKEVTTKRANRVTYAVFTGECIRKGKEDIPIGKHKIQLPINTAYTELLNQIKIKRIKEETIIIETKKINRRKYELEAFTEREYQIVQTNRLKTIE